MIGQNRKNIKKMTKTQQISVVICGKIARAIRNRAEGINETPAFWNLLTL